MTEEGTMGEVPFRIVEAGAGLRWIAKGWQLFLKAPWIWVGLALIWLVVTTLLNLVPLVGSVAAALFQVVFLGGIFLAAEAADRGETPTFDYAFQIFRHPRLNTLLALGVVHLLFSLLLGLLFAIGMAVGMASVGHGWPGGMPVFNPAAYLFGLLILTLLLCYLMAVWFAPLLILFSGLELLPALKTSFRAVVANIAPFLLYGLAMTLLSLLAILPLGIGLLLLIPLALLSTYRAWREIFRPDWARG